MENVSSSWVTTAKTNLEKLDTVEHMGLRITVGAMRMTPGYRNGDNHKFRAPCDLQTV